MRVEGSEAGCQVPGARDQGLNADTRNLKPETRNPNTSRSTLYASPSTIFLLAALSAILLVLSFPSPLSGPNSRAGFFPLAWIALAPWLAILPRLSFRNAAQVSLVFGFLFFGGLVYWVALFGYLPWAILSLYQSLFILAAGVAIWLCRRLPTGGRIAAAASLWTVFEWLRGQGTFGFTWGWLGYSQSPWLGFIQLASIAGVPGLSFLIVLHNAAFAEAIFSSARSVVRRLAPLGLVWVVIGATVLAGRLTSERERTRLLHASYPSLKVAIVQPSEREPRAEDITRPWSAADTAAQLALLERLTRQAAQSHPALIIWPESAVPEILNRDIALRRRVEEIARRSRAWLLAGSHLEGKGGGLYNSAFLFSPEGRIRDRYDKVQLVPFGEFVPGRNWLPGVHNYPIRDTDLSPGRGFFPLRIDASTLGVAICFESIFPHISRELVRNGANLLVIITNDGWFKRTAAPAQHRQMAVFRAVETRRWVARAASTGISCLISPSGDIVQELGLYQSGVLTWRIEVRKGETCFVRHGDWFIVVALATAIACVLWGWKRSVEQMNR